MKRTCGCKNGGFSVERTYRCTIGRFCVYQGAVIPRMGDFVCRGSTSAQKGDFSTQEVTGAADEGVRDLCPDSSPLLLSLWPYP